MRGIMSISHHLTEVIMDYTQEQLTDVSEHKNYNDHINVLTDTQHNSTPFKEYEIRTKRKNGTCWYSHTYSCEESFNFWLDRISDDLWNTEIRTSH